VLLTLRVEASSALAPASSLRLQMGSRSFNLLHPSSETSMLVEEGGGLLVNLDALGSVVLNSGGEVAEVVVSVVPKTPKPLSNKFGI